MCRIVNTTQSVFFLAFKYNTTHNTIIYNCVVLYCTNRSPVTLLILFLAIYRIYCRSSTSFEEMSNETNSTNITKNYNLPENYDTFSVGTFKSISEQIQRTHSHATLDLKRIVFRSSKNCNDFKLSVHKCANLGYP